MSKTLNPTLSERQAYPFAVGVRMEGQPETEYTHFTTMGGAHVWAHLFETRDNTVTRWVAITEPEYLSTAVVPGWRQVTYFNLP